MFKAITVSAFVVALSAFVASIWWDDHRWQGFATGMLFLLVGAVMLDRSGEA